MRLPKRFNLYGNTYHCRRPVAIRDIAVTLERFYETTSFPSDFICGESRWEVEDAIVDLAHHYIFKKSYSEDLRRMKHFIRYAKSDDT